MTDHQQNQKKIIEELEKLIRQNSPTVSAVTPTEDFWIDRRITLTSIHIPADFLKKDIQEKLIEPLKADFPDLHYYSNHSLHLTIKNIRVISDPPNFNDEDVSVVKEVFSEVLGKHKKFSIYFHKLLLTQNSIALVGTTDAHFDDIVLDLDETLRARGMADDKMYANKKYFFCNITLARFSTRVTKGLEKRVEQLSHSLDFKPYVVDSVNLVSGNAVMNYLQIHQTWKLE